MLLELKGGKMFLLNGEYSNFLNKINFKKLLILFLLFVLSVAIFSVVFDDGVNGASLKKITIDNKTSGGINSAVGSVKNHGTIYLKKGIYKQDNTNIKINKSLTIVGKGSCDDIVINAKKKGRVFKIMPSGKLTLKNITIINGYSDNGGAIYNSKNGICVIDNCNFKNNVVKVKYSDYGGGAIASFGYLKVKNSTFSNNNGHYWGGAIYFDSNKGIISESTFYNNKAFHGGAIHICDGDVNIINSTFSKNYASEEGGAVSNYGNNTLVANSKFLNNKANYGASGIFSGFGTLKVITSYFKNNIVVDIDDGAVIYSDSVNKGTKIKIANSTFKYNSGTSILSRSRNSIIVGNNISINKNSFGAIDIIQTKNVTVSNNKIYSNNENASGIYIYGSINKILSNMIQGKFNYGIYIEGSKNNISKNNIKSKINYNINNFGIYTLKNSQYNKITKNIINSLNCGISINKGYKSNIISYNTLIKNNVGLSTSYTFKNKSNIFIGNKVDIKVQK